MSATSEDQQNTPAMTLTPLPDFPDFDSSDVSLGLPLDRLRRNSAYTSDSMWSGPTNRSLVSPDWSPQPQARSLPHLAPTSELRVPDAGTDGRSLASATIDSIMSAPTNRSLISPDWSLRSQPHSSLQGRPTVTINGSSRRAEDEPPLSSTVLNTQGRQRRNAVRQAKKVARRQALASVIEYKASLVTIPHAKPALLRPDAVPPLLCPGSPSMAHSWSDAVGGDLVANLSESERSRQELLWDLVASEERYGLELFRLNEIFIQPLLHPDNPRPPSYTAPLSPVDDPDYYESDEYLPIASRFLSSRSPIGHATDTATTIATQTYQPLRITDDEFSDIGRDEVTEAARAGSMKQYHYRAPSGAALDSLQQKRQPLIHFRMRFQNSLLPSPRQCVPGTSEASLERHNGLNDGAKQLPGESATRTSYSRVSRIVRQLRKKPPSSGSNSASDSATILHSLPEDLRRCLEILENVIIPGHKVLRDCLRKRYDEQFPLVRSLYATYVSYLEPALEQVADALTQAHIPGMKSKKQGDIGLVKLYALMQTLDDTAAERGEKSLAISLSMPFQRLLEYPPLLRKLLSHTDGMPSFEYRSVLFSASQVEAIVLGIEDEKKQRPWVFV
ncbi:hypothetical protein BKA62DRAFT_739398 [Auriculariales sp. MPI-PUGE-AT-0066]|nr:hypothetical protein BKA62DRAFT_739398 [Auriculariales sp. MPI-PUGE-AT-0066]